MFKRLLGLCIIAVLALAVFTGCNRNAEEENSGRTAEEWVGQWDLPDEERWFGPFEETVTVRLAMPINAAHEFDPEHEDHGNNVWTRAFRDYLNIEVEIMWEAVHMGGDYETRLNLAIASGDVPDLIRFENATQFANMQSANQLMDLNTLFPRFAYPLVHELMAFDGIALDWGRVGEGLYGLPIQGVNISSPRMLYLRQDWFEDTGLPMPTTFEEFIYAAEMMARANNAFALGQDQHLIRNGMADLHGPANAFGAHPTVWVEDGDGGLMYGTLDPRMMDVLEIYARLYYEGLIDPGFTSLDGGALGGQLTTNQVAAISSQFWLNGWPLVFAYGTDYWAEWIIMPMLPSETLQGPLMVTAESPAAGRLVSIREGFEHPEAFFKMWNFTTSVLEDQERGAERHGTFHPRIGDTPFVHFPDPMQNPITHHNLTAHIRDGVPLDELPMRTHCWGRMAYFQDYFDGTLEETIWGHWSSWIGDHSTWGIVTNYLERGELVTCLTMGLQTPGMIDHWPDLTDLERTFTVEVVTGRRPVSDFLDYFVPAWMAMGGEQITEEVNEWWSERN